MTPAAHTLPQRFPKRRAFITGAASGLGLACAESLAREGWQLFLTDSDAGRLDLVTQSFRRDGAQVMSSPCDVRDAAALQAVVDAAAGVAGGIDVAIHCAGVSVAGLRYAALAINGALCALAGSYLVLAQNPGFVPHMTAGRGYMALAAMIFGQWHPVGALAACLLFGFLDALAIRMQGVVLPGIGEVPVQAIQALPYVLTVVLLAGFFGRARAPAALGVPYVKER